MGEDYRRLEEQKRVIDERNRQKAGDAVIVDRALRMLRQVFCLDKGLAAQLVLTRYPVDPRLVAEGHIHTMKGPPIVVGGQPKDYTSVLGVINGLMPKEGPFVAAVVIPKLGLRGFVLVDKGGRQIEEASDAKRDGDDKHEGHGAPAAGG